MPVLRVNGAAAILTAKEKNGETGKGKEEVSRKWKGESGETAQPTGSDSCLYI